MKWLVRVYPPSWQRRYGDELLALLESRPRTPRVVPDVLLGALDAWLRPQLGPSRALAPAGGAKAPRRRDRFDKFTPRSRAALELAQAEAKSLHHGFIGTEHLLLGLLHDPDNIAVRVLHTFGVKPASVRAAVEYQLGSAAPTDLSTGGLTIRTKRVIELSVEEANRLGHSYVGTEHLLLGLLREGQGLAAIVLREVGSGDVDEVRRRVVRVLNNG
jgi:Clp amino terminal domain, pathogenicity island component